MAERLLVVGGDAAGMSAASRVGRSDSEFDITVLERGEFISYAACGLPYFLSGDIPDPATLLVRDASYFTAQGIEIRRGHEAIAIDATRSSVTVVGGHGASTYEQPYDRLLIATGARASVPPVSGASAANVFTIRNYSDALRLADHLERHRPRSATIVGAGYLGLEMAEALVARCESVSMVEAGSQAFPGSDRALARRIEDELRSHGVTLRLGEFVNSLELRDADTVHAVATDRSSWDADLVILAVGAVPNVELAVSGGVATDETGAIATDAAMHTNLENIWAAGDCVSSLHLVSERKVWLPLGPAANKQGRVAGASIAGGQARFGGVVGTNLVKVFDLHIGRTGLSEIEAAEHGFAAITETITADDLAHYYPGSEKTSVKLVADRVSGRLLGGQVVGRSGVAGRINVIAAALHARMDLDQFAGLDLGYAPPFAPVWDPLLIAGNKLGSALAEMRG